MASLAPPSTTLFCNPNTSQSLFPDKQSQWGFGCGYGSCAPNGQYCVCDADHEHSSYFLFMQDCWDPKYMQTSILVVTSVMMFVGGLYSAAMVFRTKSEVRTICVGAALCNIFSLIANLTLYLEGFNGLATSFFMCASVFFGIRTIGHVCWLFLKPSLRMSGRSEYARKERVPKLYVPAAMFLGMVIPNFAAYATVSPYPADRNFVEFNRRMSGFFFVSAILPYFVCFAPFLYMLILFERVFVRSESRSGEMQREGTRESTRGPDRSPEGSKIASDSPTSPSSPGYRDPNQQSPLLRTSVLFALLRKITIMLFGSMLVTSISSMYMGINVLVYNQTPIQIIVFIFFKMYGPALSVLVRYFVKQAQNTINSSKRKGLHASKSLPSKEETLASPSHASKMVYESGAWQS